MKLPFIERVGDILGDTQNGISGSDIARYFSDYSVKYNVNIPYCSYPFLNAPNKRTALKENLKCFSDEQQFIIIKELCELDRFNNDNNVKNLKIQLISQYQYLDSSLDVVNKILIDETLLWLQDYPKAMNSYQSALNKFNNRIFERNLLDDLRLSLELLLKQILNNDKSLENQLSEISSLLNIKNGSKELNNMFQKLIDYFCKYQNTHIKHNDNVIEEEVEFILEITSSFMKHFIRMSK